MNVSIARTLTLTLGLAAAGCSSDFCVDFLDGCQATGGNGGAPSTSASMGTTTTASTSSIGGSGSTTTSDASSSTDASSSVSTGTGIATNCVPSVNNASVADTCGFFVNPNSGSDAGLGTKGDPFQSFEKAVLEAKQGQGIYLCVQSYGTFGAVLQPGVSIFGGLTCDAMFSYQAAQVSNINSGAGDVPVVTFSGAAEAYVQNVQINQTNASADSASSIVVLADHANLHIVASKFQGAAAKSGVPGKDGAFPSAADDGPQGLPGHAACFDDMTIPGAPAVIKDCGAQGMSVGGKGGAGGLATGQNGDAGTPALAMGQGGMGDPGSGWNCTLGGGMSGEPGAAGMLGMGAVGPGTITAAGYQGGTGVHGTIGGIGQGGGGSGGAHGPANCQGVGMTAGAGASGASGGAGGCGGTRGQGGEPGGSAFALVSIDSIIDVAASTFSTGNAGNGGGGGTGRNGGNGGNGGSAGGGFNGSPSSCAGGKGGSGGTGGNGGGGQGGHAACIAFIGTPPVVDPMSKMSCAEGTAGGGGNAPGNPIPGKGSDGKRCNTIEFTAADATCTVP